jgi:hypothetical protein
MLKSREVDTLRFGFILDHVQELYSLFFWQEMLKQLCEKKNDSFFSSFEMYSIAFVPRTRQEPLSHTSAKETRPVAPTSQIVRPSVRLSQFPSSSQLAIHYIPLFFCCMNA